VWGSKWPPHVYTFVNNFKKHRSRLTIFGEFAYICMPKKRVYVTSLDDLNCWRCDVHVWRQCVQNVMMWHNVLSVSRQAIFDNSFIYNVLWVIKFSPGTAKCVSLTDDLEIQGYVILHVILPISTTALVRTPNLCFFLMFYVSDNSLRVLPNVWPWRMTLKSKVTLFSTWPYLYQLLHMIQHRMCFCF